MGPERRRLPPLPPPLEPRPPRPDHKPHAADGKPSRKATAGRFAVLNSFVDHGARTVDTTAAAVWLVVYREVQRDGLATVAHATIAERLNVRRLTVTRALKRLEAAGLVQVVRAGGWRRGPSTYRIRGSAKPRGP